MTRCIVKVFEVLPPDSDDVPEADVLHDVTVQLQPFAFNTFGYVDNLAHIWVLKKDVKKKNGHPLPLEKIGFGGKNKEVRESLPGGFVEYLCETRCWYKHFENFRHALVYWIPHTFDYKLTI